MTLESGIRSGRLEFVRETTEGTTPTDPAWSLFSDAYQTVAPTLNTTITPRRAVGEHDVQEFNPGSEDHTLEVTYDLMQALVDSSGDMSTETSGSPNDAAADGILRGSEGEAINTHTVVERMTYGGNGTAGGGSRGYLVMRGAKVDSVTMSGEPASGDPITVTLSYMAPKGRIYRVDQPDSSTTLDVRSTDAGDTSQTVTIEDDGGSTSEGVSLNGTTVVTTTASFGSIDAINLDAETVGDVVIEDGSGNELARLHGSASYADREGDLGIPLLGAGSHASAIGNDAENIIGDTFVKPQGGGEFLDPNTQINSAELSVENNAEATARVSDIGKEISFGPRDIQVSATLFGERTSFHTVKEHLQNTEEDIQWELTNSVVRVKGATLDEPGDATREAEQAVMQLDNTFTGKSIVVTQTA